MQMPTLQDEHKRLHVFAGTWTAEETVHPTPWDPKGGPAKGRAEARVGLDGFFVIYDYTQERNGQVSYRGHGVYGWDPQAKSYTMHWFDSMGSSLPEPARGRWAGDTLTFEQQTPMGFARYIYAFQGDRRHTFRMETSQDGKTWAPFVEGVYQRT